MAYAALDRPAWKEVVGIVLACAVVLVLLVRLDRAAYEAQMDRARKAIAAERAERVPADRRARSSVPLRHPAPRTESLGSRGPIVVGVGGAWGAGTAATVPDVASRAPAPVASGALRRITGPSVAADVTTVSDAAQNTARPSGATRAEQPPRPTATAAAEAAAQPRRPADTLVPVLAGVGLALMALGGALVGLGRR